MQWNTALQALIPLLHVGSEPDQTFLYDALNRLTSAQNAGTNCAATTVNGKTEYWGNSYGYDAWGNLLQKSVTKCSAENFSAVALANNRLSGYSYDAAGNMTNDGLGHAFTFDAESRIAQVNSGAVNYVYDADGDRVRKDVSGQPSTEYFYFGGNIIAESNATSGWTNYVFFGGERVARKDSTGVSYYFSDHLKTASVITDSAGNIKSESDFYPWGGELQLVNNDSNHYKFTGKERDSETQLDYFGARYYSNGLGRFTTPDWAAKATAVPYADFADPQSLNLYSYVRNIPTTKYDADGHCPGDGCKDVKVETKVIEEPKIIQNKPVDGEPKTGVKGEVQQTITVNGKPLDHVKLGEKNENKVTLNGEPHKLGGKEGPSETNNAGQVNDHVGLLAPAGSKADDKALVETLQTGAVNYTNTNTITFTTPSGETCSCTTTRTLTNVGPDGKASSTYKLDPGHPVVKSAEQPKEK